MLTKIIDKFKSIRFWKHLVRDVLILIVIITAVNLYQTRHTPNIAPLLQEQLISGQSIELKQLAKSSPVLLYFWGSWCPMCNITSTTISDLSKNYQVVSIAITSGDDSDVKSFVDNKNYQFPIINDPSGIISQEWGVYVTPTFFIINTKGEISFVTAGISSSWGLKLRLWLSNFS